MSRYLKRVMAILAGTARLVAVMGCVSAQPAPAPAVAPLSSARLDQLTAPVALYSDPLLGMVLTAATYPGQVVEAARWLDADEHASLKGDELDAALAQERWDASVKALVATPEVLRMMSENLGWTEQLGDAFLAQQAAVMESIQRLRHRAAAAGGLQSGPQQTVSTEEGEVIIEPAAPGVIYVPCYSPLVYGRWPWPSYPAFYFPPPAGFCSPGPLISFGLGFGITRPYWGWGRWNWPHHEFYVAPRRTRRGPIPMRPRVHAPAHHFGPDGTSPRGSRDHPGRPAPARKPGLAPRARPGHRSVRPAPTRTPPPP